MNLNLVLLISFPAILIAATRVRRAPKPEILRVCLISIWCALLSSPFATDHAVGTGESYNYSLSAADTIQQFREGTFPVSVGQSEYAFNGRVHPLRTAPYLPHLCAVIDWLTLHTLPFWQIQNLVLMASLFAAGLLSYWMLVRICPTSRWIALILASWYVSSPALLSAAYGQDLYMTVAAAPFLPVAFSGLVQFVRRARFSDLLMVAGGTSGCLLAHPPVATWLSLVVLPAIGAGILRHGIKPELLVKLAWTALCALLLSSWSLISVLTLDLGDLLGRPAGQNDLLVQSIFKTLQSNGWHALLPVTAGANQLADFQLGYAGWLLFLLLCLLSFRSRSIIGLLLAVVGIGMTALLLPIPIVTEWGWRVLPEQFSAINNIWAMQRGYLVLGGVISFGVAAVWDENKHPWELPGNARKVAWLTLLAVGIWSLSESAKFVRRGFEVRRDAKTTERIYSRSNLDLTIVSYAFLKVPDNFIPAPRVPELELRFIQLDTKPSILIDNATSGGVHEVVAQGTFTHASAEHGNLQELQPLLQLRKGKLYRLVFDFAQGMDADRLLILGNKIILNLPLKAANQARSFGILPGQTRAVAIRAPSETDEELKLLLNPGSKPGPTQSAVASFRLEEIATDKLSLRLVRLSPQMEFVVDAPSDGWLETPRIFQPNFTALVDGKPAVPRRGPNGLLWVPVPQGQHKVIVTFDTPRLLKAAALITLSSAGLLLFLAAISHSTAVKRHYDLIPHLERIVGSRISQLSILLLISVAPCLYWWTKRESQKGSLELTLAWPIDRAGMTDPLVSFGKGEDSAVLFARYTDPHHIQFGIVSRELGMMMGENTPIDYARLHRVTISAAPLFGKVRNSDDPSAWWRKSTVRVQLDDRNVFSRGANLSTYSGHDFAIGKAPVELGAIQPVFGGKILSRVVGTGSSAENPLPSISQLSREVGPLRLSLQLPIQEIGNCEPLLSMGEGPDSVCLFVHYIDANHVRLGIEGPAVGLVTSELIPHDYNRAFDLTLSLPEFYPPDHSELAVYSKLQLQRLRSIVRIIKEGRLLASSPSGIHDGMKGPRRIWWGENKTGAKFPSARFTGIFISGSRIAGPANWPIPPGRPEDAIVENSFGPIEICTVLPSNATGKIQPILVTGKPGEGTITMIHYLDHENIRIGIDIWGKALHWSGPVKVDYASRQKIVISHTALWPPDSRNMAGTEITDDYRSSIKISINGALVLNERQATYDSAAKTITVGESLIGGSHNERYFTGEIVSVRRLKRFE